MRSFADYLTESRKEYAIGVIGNQGGVLARLLNPDEVDDALHRDIWRSVWNLSKHFRVNKDLLVTDDWPTLDDYFAINDWCDKEGFNIKRYQPTLHSRPIPIDSFDPRDLREGVGLTFAQILNEATDQKTAIAKLKAISKAHKMRYTSYGYVGTEWIFNHDPEDPPSQRWNDNVTYREKVGGVKIQQIPVDKLIPTQTGVKLGGVEYYIKMNPNRWNDKFEVVRVVLNQGRFYVMDGHHRSAAAILMGYPTVPGELQPVT